MLLWLHLFLIPRSSAYTYQRVYYKKYGSNSNTNHTIDTGKSRINQNGGSLYQRHSDRRDKWIEYLKTEVFGSNSLTAVALTDSSIYFLQWYDNEPLIEINVPLEETLSSWFSQKEQANSNLLFIAIRSTNLQTKI